LGLAWASTVATSILVLLAAPALGIVRSQADRLVEGLLFPAQRAGRELLRRAAGELGRLRGPDDLLAFLRTALDQALGCVGLRIVSGPPGEPLQQAPPPGPAPPPPL